MENSQKKPQKQVLWYYSCMNEQYTSAQVAEMPGDSRSMVLLVCQEKELPRVGKQYVLGEDEIAIIKGSY